MKVFRIILLGLAMALFVMNFWTIRYEDWMGKASLWAYFRIVLAFVLVLLLLRMILKDRKKKKP